MDICNPLWPRRIHTRNERRPSVTHNSSPPCQLQAVAGAMPLQCGRWGCFWACHFPTSGASQFRNCPNLVCNPIFFSFRSRTRMYICNPVCIFAIPYFLVSNPVCISAIYYGHGASTASGRRGGQAQGIRCATSTCMARGTVALSLGARAGGYGSVRKSNRWSIERPFHLGREWYSCRKLCALAEEASNKERNKQLFSEIFGPMYTGTG